MRQFSHFNISIFNLKFLKLVIPMVLFVYPLFHFLGFRKFPVQFLSLCWNPLFQWDLSFSSTRNSFSSKTADAKGIAPLFWDEHLMIFVCEVSNYPSSCEESDFALGNYTFPCCWKCPLTFLLFSGQEVNYSVPFQQLLH